jgi:thiosulfate dehydrogenase
VNINNNATYRKPIIRGDFMLNYKKMLIVLALSLPSFLVSADEFTKADLTQWDSEFQTIVKQGRAAFTDPALGSNGVACAQCHPNAANTHPETYPKFQKQIGKVISLWEMVNWCLRNPLEGKPLAADDPKMTALVAYITNERKGVKLDAGKH